VMRAGLLASLDDFYILEGPGAKIAIVESS
jgi:hypothetical protein